MSKVRAHIVVSGIVQGVGFRYAVSMRANTVGVTGWVMNRRDGNVEAVFEGENNEVEQMIMWCRQGPSGSIVDHIDINWEKYKGEFNNFRIKNF